MTLASEKNIEIEGGSAPQGFRLGIFSATTFIEIEEIAST